MRDYLDKGGILLVVYQDTKDHNGGRTTAQKRIYDKLKKRYASQIIDFPIANFPSTLTGATYLVPQKGGVFEMTNRGAQIAHEIKTVFQILEQAGLQEKLANHAKLHGRAPETFFALGKHYQA